MCCVRGETHCGWCHHNCVVCARIALAVLRWRISAECRKVWWLTITNIDFGFLLYFLCSLMHGLYSGHWFLGMSSFHCPSTTWQFTQPTKKESYIKTLRMSNYLYCKPNERNYFSALSYNLLCSPAHACYTSSYKTRDNTVGTHEWVGLYFSTNGLV